MPPTWVPARVVRGGASAGPHDQKIRAAPTAYTNCFLAPLHEWDLRHSTDRPSLPLSSPDLAVSPRRPPVAPELPDAGNRPAEDAGPRHCGKSASHNPCNDVAVARPPLTGPTACPAA